MSRFSYDEEGHSIVLADGSELLVYDGRSEGGRWRADVGAPIVGVGSNAIGVVALDARGVLTVWSHETATQVRSLELGVAATALAHDHEGRCAAVHPGGVVTALGGQPRPLRVPGATAAAFASDDEILIGTEEGALHRFDAQGNPLGTAQVPGPVRSIAWNAGGFFLVANGGSVHRVDGLDVSHVTNAPEGQPVKAVASSARGDRLGLQIGDRMAVVLAYPSRETEGHVQYPDRTICGVAFGAGPWFGVGLDGGDGNKFDLASGATHRTDPHPGRPLNRWLLMSAFGPPEPAPSAPTGAASTAEQLAALGPLLAASHRAQTRFSLQLGAFFLLLGLGCPASKVIGSVLEAVIPSVFIHRLANIPIWVVLIMMVAGLFLAGVGFVLWWKQRSASSPLVAHLRAHPDDSLVAVQREVFVNRGYRTVHYHFTTARGATFTEIVQQSHEEPFERALASLQLE